MLWFWVILGLVVLYVGVSYVRRTAAANGLGSYESLKGLMEARDRQFVVVDVRSPQEYKAGHIPGAVNIPHDTISARPPKTTKDSLVVLYCHSGARAMAARSALKSIGFTNIASFGRVDKWRGQLVTGTKPGVL